MPTFAFVFDAILLLLVVAFAIGLPLLGIYLLWKYSRVPRKVIPAVLLIAVPLALYPFLKFFAMALVIALFGTMQGGFGA